MHENNIVTVIHVYLFYLLQLSYIFSECPHPPFVKLNKLRSFSCYWLLTNLTTIFNEKQLNTSI